MKSKIKIKKNILLKIMKMITKYIIANIKIEIQNQIQMIMLIYLLKKKKKKILIKKMKKKIIMKIILQRNQ
jgi:hypothetical protein